jgi:hypothetical protein
MQASKPKAALALVSKAAPVSLGMRAASVASVVEVFVGFPSGPRNVPLADAERATMLGDVASCIKNGPGIAAATRKAHQVKRRAVDGQGVGNGLCVEHFQRRKIRRHQRRAFSSVQTLGHRSLQVQFLHRIPAIRALPRWRVSVSVAATACPVLQFPLELVRLSVPRFACSMLAGAAVEHFLKGHYFGLPDAERPLFHHGAVGHQ